MIKLLLVFCLSATCGVAWAQTHLPAQNTNTNKPQSVLTIDSKGSYFDGIANQLVYTDHVFVTDHEKAWLHCERLTVDMPKGGAHPTNIVAQTNVVIDFLDAGQTNHITCGLAVYAYQLSDPVTNVLNSMTNVVYATTNETVTFTLDNPTVVNSQMKGTGDKLVYDVPKKSFSGITSQEMKLPKGSGTNASPFGLFNK